MVGFVQMAGGKLMEKMQKLGKIGEMLRMTWEIYEK